MSAQYSELLRDPRWQKKRLEIMDRDEFTCQHCFDNESTLNVHHNYYEHGRAPWDYPAEALLTLCEECHEEETKNRKSEEQLLLRVCRHIGMSASNLNGLTCALATFEDRESFGDYLEYELTWTIEHLWEIRGYVRKLMERETLIRANRHRAEGGKLPALPTDVEDYAILPHS